MVDTFVLDRPYVSAGEISSKADDDQRDALTAWIRRFASIDISLITGLEIKDEKLVVEHIVRASAGSASKFKWNPQGTALLRSKTSFDVDEPPPFWID